MKKFLLLSTIILLSVITRAQTPTWSENVACIVYTHCTKCHNPAGIAPTSLLTYSEAVARATEMKTQVRSGAMPPWKASRTYSHFADERYLTAAEIDVISRWVDGGTPEGNSSHAPVAPVYSHASELDSIGVMAQMPYYTVPSSITSDLYRCFVIHPTPSSTAPFITGIECIPGNTAIVHHINIFQDTTNVPDSLDAHDPGPGYTYFGGDGSPGSVLISTWAPGSGAYFLPEGMGLHLKPHAKIVLQIHYPVAGAGGTDSSKVAFQLSNDTSLRTVSVYPPLNATYTITDGPLMIPADSIRTFHESYQFTRDVTVLSLFPHMHLTARSIKVFAVPPVGDTIPLIDIPLWDFHWQGFYNFRQPVKIPAMSWVYSVATFDNTAANPENPNHPPRDVHAGDATTDEMYLSYFAFLTYEPDDESIIIDTSSSIPTYLGCSYTGVGISTISSPQIRVFPNPAISEVEFQLNDNMNGQLQVFNAMGQLVFEKNKVDSDMSINVSEWASGLYQVVLSSADKRFSTKFLKQ
jgi:hypothetical protein